MPEKIQLEILFDPSTGNIAVNGPIHNKVICFGILECAKNAIQNFEGGPATGLILPKGRFNIPMNGDGE